jgi:hypothetical protein
MGERHKDFKDAHKPGYKNRKYEMSFMQHPERKLSMQIKKLSILHKVSQNPLRKYIV